MKVRLLSDLHLEFNDNCYIDIPEGDVLVLAGDICLANEVDNYIPFFQQCVAKYNKVFYIMGNHEHYGGDFNKTEQILREKLPKGITFLHNQSEYYNGVHFVGATLWTNFNKDKKELDDARSYMNDYHIVKGFTPEQAVEENTNTLEWFDQCVSTLVQGPVVMITHHAPTQSSVQGRYKETTHAYANNLNHFIKTHPNITHWTHGHIHHNNDYMVGNCRIMSNTRGYEGSEMNPNFDINFEFEV